MALEAPEEDYFDGAFEFDAPQWIDLGRERDHLENETNYDQYDWWFEKVHALHSPNINTSPEPEPKAKKHPLWKSVLGKEGSKLLTESGKSSLPDCKSSLSGKSRLTEKSSSSLPTHKAEVTTSKESTIDETNTTISKPGELVKKPRKCWQLNGHSSLDFSPKRLASLPLDLQPKRASSNSLSNKSSCTSLPERCRNDDTASPLARASPKKLGVKNKNLNSSRRSCPQKLEKSKKAWNESSTKTKIDDVDEELQQMIEQHNRKILNQRSQYDLNGRKIRKTTSPLKTSKKENVKPTVEANVNETLEMDKELLEIINNHNRRIWAAQNSEYDLNGRRIRKANTTAVTPPTKTKPAAQSRPSGSKDHRKTRETSQKRKNPTKISDANKTVAATAASNTLESSTDFEHEIQEIIRVHNSRLAAKKAKK